MDARRLRGRRHAGHDLHVGGGQSLRLCGLRPRLHGRVRRRAERVEHLGLAAGPRGPRRDHDGLRQPRGHLARERQAHAGVLLHRARGLSARGPLGGAPRPRGGRQRGALLLARLHRLQRVGLRLAHLSR